MKICFIDPTNIEYSFKDINDPKIRGAESIFINLSKTLSENGNQIFIFSNCKDEYLSQSYSWTNISKIHNFKNNFDIVISNNDTQILDIIDCKKKFVISHSVQSIEKSLRKKQFFSYFKNRPTYLLLGKYHQSKMSKVFSIFGSKIIDYGVDKIFEDKEILPYHNDKLSYFTSRQDRNLDILIDIWKNDIFEKKKNFTLHVTPINEDLRKYNIFNRSMLPRPDFINEISSARMIILPGHTAELYCLAALEALELCLPVVTMGIGSLSERVNHEFNGLISKNYKEFSNNIIELYENDTLWYRLRSNLIANRGKNSWFNAAKKFMEIVNNK